MMDHVAFEPFMQKGSHDCAIACLAIYLGLPYANVAAAAPRKWTTEGLTPRQIQNLGRKLGHPLKLQKDFSGDDLGIISLSRTPGYEESGGHVALFLRGVIYTTASGLLWTDVQAYLAHHRFTVDGLITRRDA